MKMRLRKITLTRLEDDKKPQEKTEQKTCSCGCAQEKKSEG